MKSTSFFPSIPGTFAGEHPVDDLMLFLDEQVRQGEAE